MHCLASGACSSFCHMDTRKSIWVLWWNDAPSWASEQWPKNKPATVEATSQISLKKQITKYDKQTSFPRLNWGEQDSEGALYVSLAHSCSTMSFCRLDLFRSKFSDRPNKYSAKAHKDVIQSLHIAWSFLWHHFPPPALWNNVTRLLRRESLELNESLTRVYREFNESLTRSGPGCKSLHSGLRCFEWRHWLQWWQCQSLHLGLSC